MEKSDLILKMKEELSNYQVGLHNIHLKSYNELLSWIPDEKREIVNSTGTKITEKSIADSILKKGLFIGSPIGLRSTVMPIKKMDSNSLDYSFYLHEGITWNVILAIPYCLNYDGTDYFIGDLNCLVNIANTYLFQHLLPAELVYGYYNINVTKRNDGFLNRENVDFGDKIEFFDNPYFIEKIDSDKKDLFFKRISEEKENLLRYLKLANSDSDLRRLIRPINKNNRNERIKVANLRGIIEETRAQGKRLCFEKK